MSGGVGHGPSTTRRDETGATTTNKLEARAVGMGAGAARGVVHGNAPRQLSAERREVEM